MKRITVALLLLVVTTAVWADDDRSRGFGAAAEGAQVRGAWQVLHVPGEGGPPPFAMLMVFTRDGGVVQTDAGPPNPLQFSTGLGEWERMVEDGRYEIRCTQLEFDASQNHVGNFHGLLTVTFDPAKGTFTGTVRVRFCDVDDVVLFEGEGTVSGKRIARN